jgi:hypothetical protein
MQRHKSTKSRRERSALGTDSGPSRFIISLINFQHELPNIPVHDVKVSVRLGGRVPGHSLLLPEERDTDYHIADGYLHFSVPRPETLAMFALQMD